VEVMGVEPMSNERHQKPSTSLVWFIFPPKRTGMGLLENRQKNNHPIFWVLLD